MEEKYTRMHTQILAPACTYKLLVGCHLGMHISCFKEVGGAGRKWGMLCYGTF